jgi:RNA polymerase sigma-70 factor, ECF subfamily
LNEPTDASLVALARRADGSARETLVRRYLRPAYLAALAIVRNVADAEDVAQDGLMTAMQRLDQCREPDRFAGWLFAIVRHRALTHLERRGARADRELHPWPEAAPAPPPAPSAARADEVLARGRLLAALDHLSEPQRQVVLLHDLESWTHGEIAAALAISEVMSRQHLFVARRVLRDHLAAEPRSAAPPARGRRHG